MTMPNDLDSCLSRISFLENALKVYADPARWNDLDLHYLERAVCFRTGDTGYELARCALEGKDYLYLL